MGDYRLCCADLFATRPRSSLKSNFKEHVSYLRNLYTAQYGNEITVLSTECTVYTLPTNFTLTVLSSHSCSQIVLCTQCRLFIVPCSCTGYTTQGQAPSFIFVHVAISRPPVDNHIMDHMLSGYSPVAYHVPHMLISPPCVSHPASRFNVFGQQVFLQPQARTI